MEQKKLSKYEQLLLDIRIAEAELQESQAQYEDDLKEAQLFNMPSPSNRYVERCRKRLGELLNRLDLLTDYAFDNVEEDYYPSDDDF